MFKNIDSKIKVLAETITWLGIIASIVGGFLLIAIAEDFISGITIMIFGSLCSWISSFLLYGFGEMIELLYKIEYNTRNITGGNNDTDLTNRFNNDDEEDEDKTEVKKFICPKCESLVNFGDAKCSNCGAAFDWNKN